MAVRGMNQIHLVEYTEDSENVRAAAIYEHEREVWDLAGHPTNEELLLVLDGCSDKSKVSVCKYVQYESAARLWRGQYLVAALSASMFPSCWWYSDV